MTDTERMQLEFICKQNMHKDIRLIDLNKSDIKFRTEPDDTEEFWTQHNAKKTDYLSLVSDLKAIYTAILEHNEFTNTLNEFMNTDKYGDAVQTWFGKSMMYVNVINNEYCSDDGRHRCLAAKLMDVPVPVIIDNTYNSPVKEKKWF